MTAPLIRSKNLSLKNLVISYVIWWAGYTLIHAFVLYYSASLSFELALQDALITNLLLALAAYSMINIIRFYQPRQILRLVDSIGLSVISMLMMNWISQHFTEDPAYLQFLNSVLIARCFFAWIMISLFAATASLWFYLRDQHEAESRQASSEKLAREAELSRLRQQLQPHFLFNSLNSISALAGSQPEQARKMIQQLSDFLRGTLKKDDQQMVTLAEEMEHLNLYLEIEKVRFGHRLRTHLNVHDEASQLKLPSLLLQPVVENAIKFGLYDTTGEIIIRLIARKEQSYLIIQVENPYDKTTAAPKQGTGFGLNSVQRRLHLLFARQDLLTTSADETTFTTTIKIPQLI